VSSLEQLFDGICRCPDVCPLHAPYTPSAPQAAKPEKWFKTGKCVYGEHGECHSPKACACTCHAAPSSSTERDELVTAAQDALVILGGLELAVQWELAPSLMKAIRELNPRLRRALAAQGGKFNK
jgi:hypothetical protein